MYGIYQNVRYFAVFILLNLLPYDISKLRIRMNFTVCN